MGAVARPGVSRATTTTSASWRHAEPLDYDIYARDDYYFGYSSAAFKALIAELDDSICAKARSDLLKRIQRKITDDSVNGFLFQYPRLAVWSAHLQGLGFDNLLGIVDLKDARFDAAGIAAAESAHGWWGWHCGTRIAVARARGGRPAHGSFRALVSRPPLRGRPVGVLLSRVALLARRSCSPPWSSFVVVQVVPGDPVRYMMGLQADPQNVAAMRHQLGLDAPAIERYLHWVAGLLRGDFGTSYTYRVPVGTLIAERLQVSLPLAVFALVLAAAIAFPVGFAAAARRGRASDAALTACTQLGLAVPNFWLGLLLVLVFSIGLHVASAAAAFRDGVRGSGRRCARWRCRRWRSQCHRRRFSRACCAAPRSIRCTRTTYAPPARRARAMAGAVETRVAQRD